MPKKRIIKRYKPVIPAQVGKRNEIVRPPVENVFPACDKIDVRKLGMAGVRMKLERVLNAFHSFDEELWKSEGIHSSDLVKYRPQIVKLLRKVVAEPKRGSFSNRTAAIALLGELERERALPDLVAVLDSPFEQETTRGWAILTMGRTCNTKALPHLIPYLKDESPIIREKAVLALEFIGCREAITELANVVKSDTNIAVATTAVGAMRRLANKHKLPLPDVDLPKIMPSGGTTKVVQKHGLY